MWRLYKHEHLHHFSGHISTVIFTICKEWQCGVCGGMAFVVHSGFDNA